MLSCFPAAELQRYGSFRQARTTMSLPEVSLERKERNGQFLKTLGVAVNPNLPRVESDTEARFREPKEVAERTVALYVVISVAHEADRETAFSWLKNEGL